MRRKGFKLEYYAMCYDYDSKYVKNFNIFYQVIVDNLVKNLVKKKINNYYELYDFLTKEFMYHFWSKAEYEILVSSLHNIYVKDTSYIQKIDVYEQIKPNLDLICEHVINELKLDREVFKK